MTTVRSRLNLTPESLRLTEFLRYDADRGEVQTLMDGVVRHAIGVRRGLEDQMVLEAAVLELRRRGYTVTPPPSTAEAGWFADPDEEEGRPEFLWRPYLQVPGACLGLPVWHRTKAECERFIREDVLGKGFAQ